MQEINRCRVCKSEELLFVFSLGELCLSDFVDDKAKCERYPLTLMECEQCTLIQLAHTVPPNVMYAQKYWYKSSINEKIVEDLRNIVQCALTQVKMKDGDVFLDVGANDGTLLSFVHPAFKRIGVEPAINFREELITKCDIAITEFWRAELLGGIKAKIITAIGMFYDMDDPNQFIRDIKTALHVEGIFIAQMMTLRTMEEKNDIGNICHEHIEYYTYQSLVTLFEKNGLEIYQVEENDINGGSYRLYARHFIKGSIQHPEAVFNNRRFVEAINKNKDDTVKAIKKLKAEGKNVYIYGASTKGNTIAQYYGLDASLIAGAADRNPEKWGKFMVGSGIPIVSEEEARKDADYFWILPYAFLDVFMEREKGWRDKGGKFLLSTPNFQVI